MIAPRPLQAQRQAEEDAPDGHGGVDEGGVRRRGHAHPNGEGHVVHPHAQDPYSRHREHFFPTWPVQPQQEHDIEEQEPRQGEPHSHEGQCWSREASVSHSALPFSSPVMTQDSIVRTQTIRVLGADLALTTLDCRMLDQGVGGSRNHDKRSGQKVRGW
jgi:hypothetical protein